MYLTKGDAWGIPNLSSEKDILNKTKFEDYGDIAMEIQLKPSRTPYVITPTTCEVCLFIYFSLDLFYLFIYYFFFSFLFFSFIYVFILLFFIF